MEDRKFEELVKELLALNHELHGVECKGPCSQKETLKFAGVARAVLGMSNRRDGGIVIIGIDSDNVTKNLVPTGLTLEQLNTWKDYDTALADLAKYADPYVEVEIEVNLYEEKSFVVLTVQEFADIPTLCKKDCGDSKKTILRGGACYVRSRRTIETVEVCSQTEMRELLELATQKRLRQFIAQMNSVGIDLSQGLVKRNQELFDQQLEGLI